MARTDSVACVGLHHSFRTVGQACGIPSVWPCNLGSHAFVGFVGMVHEIQCGFVTRSNPSSRELRRPCIWSLARCALGLRRFRLSVTSAGDRAFSRESRGRHRECAYVARL